MQTTTATRTTTETNVNLSIRYDPSYMRTIPGIIKFVCVVLNLLGFICIVVSKFNGLSRAHFFNTVAMTGFWFTGILLIFYLFHVVERYFRIPWIQIELIFCALWTLLYLIASITVSTVNSGAFTAAAFFGFCAMIAYGYDTWLKFNAHRAGEIAQGQRRVVQQQTVIQQQTPSAFPA
ncbi:CLUMA_CG013849, isoform A [Clunio marinus]|uniref:CLUMA_CG013849, isoform A n=1 Tax=Clunio marinus TaxID=568069 RepID=A0A1J1IK14_9DIPT|nr:CLUMA_CG013849, isoform A [Clunio marinus]